MHLDHQNHRKTLKKYYVIILKKFMEKVIISGNLDSYKIVTLNDKNEIDDVIFGGESFKSIKSNIYLAQVTKVEPSLQAAFVNYGESKSGFLPFSEIHKFYYSNQDSVSDTLKSFCNPKELSVKKIDESKLGVDAVSSEGDVEELTSLDKIEFELSDSENSDESRLNHRKNEKEDRKKIAIQDVIKAGQMLLVQVFKDERGNKGVSMTTYITIPTKYFVFTANDARLSGVSRRIVNQRERVRLRSIISSFSISENSGLVVRTAANEVDSESLVSDYQRIAMKTWDEIIEKTSASQIGLIQKSESRIISSIRDITNMNTKIITDNEEVAKVISETSGSTISVKKEYTMLHRDKDISLFDKFNITEKLNDLYRDRVNLPSGGYVIINYTEALVAIDVNSGSLVREKNIEDTALKTNLEAVEKIAEQIRLRDIGGLIVIDFIDMDELENRKKIELRMKEELSLRDKARVQFTAISPFGLMEVSRQRLRTGFIEVSTTKCTHCYGTGRIFKSEVVLDELSKTISQIIASKSQFEKIKVETSFEVESMYQYYNKSDIVAICKAAQIEIDVFASSSIRYDKFTVFVKRKDSENMEEFKKFHGLSNIGESRAVTLPSRHNHQVVDKVKKPSVVLHVMKKVLAMFKPKNKPQNKKPFNKNNSELKAGSGRKFDKKVYRGSNNGPRKYQKNFNKK